MSVSNRLIFHQIGLNLCQRPTVLNSRFVSQVQISKFLSLNLSSHEDLSTFVSGDF